MNKIEKRKLYESIMLSTSKVVKKQLNEMVSRSNQKLAVGITAAINDFLSKLDDDISPVDVKKTLGTLSRTWNVSNVTQHDHYSSIQDFIKYLTIKRLKGSTVALSEEDKRYFQTYIRRSLDLWGSYDYNISNKNLKHNNQVIADFLSDALSELIPIVKNKEPTIFGICNNNVQVLEKIYNSPKYGAPESELFTYLFTGEDMGDMASDYIYNYYEY